MNTLLMLAVVAALGAQDLHITGIVSAAGAPVAEATVVARRGDGKEWHAAATAADGSFSLSIQARGEWRIWVARDGYAVLDRTIVVPEGDLPALELSPVAAPGTSLADISDDERRPFDDGSMLLARNRFDEALPQFEKFILQRPWLVKTHYNIGVCHAGLAARARLNKDAVTALDEERLAQRHYGVVLERYPDFTPALAALGESLVRTRDMDRAAAIYAHLVTLVPKDADTWYVYGDVLSWQKRLDDAQAAFEKVLEIDPGYVDATARIGAIEMIRGEYDKAIARFEFFLAHAPKSDMADLTRELLAECREKIRDRH